MALIAFKGSIKFSVSERINADLIAAVLKFREDIGGKHPGIASGNIEIHVFQFHESQKDIHESDFSLRIIYIGILNTGNLLYLIKEYIVFLRFIRYQISNICIKFQRIAVPCVDGFVQRQLYNVRIIDPDGVQVGVIQLKKQKRFTAPANAGDYLDQAVFLF